MLASINSSSSNYHSLLKADQLITAMRNGKSIAQNIVSQIVFDGAPLFSALQKRS